MALGGAGHAGLGDHERQVRRIEVPSQIANEIREVLLVGVVEGLIDPIVPALVPSDPDQLDLAAFELREDRGEVRDRLLREVDELSVLRADLPTGTRGPELLADRLAAPGDLDEDDGFVERLADDRAEAKFRSDRVLVRAESRAQPAGSAEEPDLDVVAFNPVALGVSQRRVLRLVRRRLHEPFERSLSTMAIGVRLDLTGADHVRLPGEDEHLDGIRGKHRSDPDRREHSRDREDGGRSHGRGSVGRGQRGSIRPRRDRGRTPSDRSCYSRGAWRPGLGLTLRSADVLTLSRLTVTIRP